jgi:hypothetical protein
LRADGLTAWWEERSGNEEPSRHFRGYFAEASSGPAHHVPDDLPETRGVVSELYAASIFDPAPVEGRSSARRPRVMGISRSEHTNARGPVGTIYATAEDAAEFDLENGKWWDAGWIAQLAIDPEEG